MQKILIFCFGLLVLSCNDGDLQVETLDFDSVDPQFCAIENELDRTLFFKINNDEALILTLESGLLLNEASTETIISAISDTGSQLTYRIFSDNITSDYFCSAIPLIEPAVQENIEATGGEVTISTTMNADGNFEHIIELQNITLETEENERITDLTITNFGTITTTAN